MISQESMTSILSDLLDAIIEFQVCYRQVEVNSPGVNSN